MRLSEQEIESIKEILTKFDSEALVYLYGSRVDDALKGGDIDLLVVSEKLGWKDRTDILIELKDALGEQRIDLSIKKSQDLASDPFFSSAQKVPL